jgi:membrane protease YdiL (CAAX protease family)
MAIIEILYLIKILCMLSAIICIIVFYRWVQIYNSKDIKSKIISILSIKNISLLLILSLGYGLFEIGALNLIIFGFHIPSQNYINIMNKLYSGNRIVTLLYLLLIAPISEEFIFRGVILKKACNELTFVTANILQAILFGLYHMNIIQGVYAFIAGLLLGYVAFKYKTVIASIVLHTFLNLNLSGFLLSGFYPSTTKYIISCIIGFILLLVVMRIIKKQEI